MLTNGRVILHSPSYPRPLVTLAQSSICGHSAKRYDGRPQVSDARRTSLVYWDDSYDAIICFREVTPAGSPL
jgi:hypothetical protein